MTNEPLRNELPTENLNLAAANLVNLWGQIAAVANDIAAYRRTIFIAYVREGFTEAQALELVKTI